MSTYNGLKYLVVLKNSKGRCSLVQVRASSEKDAVVMAKQKWPKHMVHSIRPGITI